MDFFKQPIFTMEDEAWIDGEHKNIVFTNGHLIAIIVILIGMFCLH